MGSHSGALVGDRFVLEAEIGRGGMGTVHRARDERTGKLVAIKRTLFAHVDHARFRREADLLARLSHPGIVGYVAHGEDEDGPWIAMEWVKGPDLAAYLRAQRPALSTCLTIVTRLCEAIAVAHAAGILHRDIKPSNVLLGGEEELRIRVADFGVARRIDASAVLTATGAVLGTPLYMAPELLRGEPASFASDVYAIGCVLFELVAGRPPFLADSPFAVVGRILLEPIPLLSKLRPDVPPELSELTARSLAKDPRERPSAPDLGAALVALARMLATAPTVARSVEAVDLTAEQRSAAVLVVRNAEGRRQILEKLSSSSAATELPDGTLLALVTDESSPDAPLLRAVRLGLSIAAQHRELVIVASFGTMASSRSEPARAAGSAMGAFPERPGVHLDEDSARVLGDRFSVAWEGRFAQIVEGGAVERHRLMGRPTPTVGRDAEIAQLEALLDAVISDGAPRVSLILAPPGQGKSRLREELLRRRALRSTPEPWLVARFEPGSDGTAWGGVARGVASMLEMGVDDDRAACRERLSAAAARHELDGPRTAFLAELTGIAGEEHAEVLALARESPRAMREGVLDALRVLIRSVAGETACTFALEDAHWADAASLALVEDLAAAADLPVAILLFARPELLDRTPDLLARRAPLRLDLAPIAPRAAARLVRAVLPRETPEEAIRRIVELGTGNPLVIEELVRAYAATGALAASPSARAVFEARIARLLPRERLVERTAALVGEVFWAEAVAAMLARTGIEVDDSLALLVREELIVEEPSSRFPDARQYRFRHALLRDAAEATIPPDVARELHGAVAHWLSGAVGADPAAIALHAELGGMPTVAGESLRKAGLAAAAAFEPGTAVRLLERALRLLPAKHEERTDLHLALCDAYRELGLPLRRLRHLARYRRLPGAEPSVVLVQEARYHLDRGLYARARTKAHLALEAARARGATQVEGLALRVLVVAARELGNLEEALARAAEALDEGRGDDLSPALRGELLGTRGTTLRRVGQVTRAIAAYEEALALARSAGVRTLEAELQNALGYLLISDSQLARARDEVMASIALRDVLGMRRGLPKTLANLGNLAIAVGDFEGAVAPLDRALAIAREHGEADGVADAMILRARVAAELADGVLARKIFAEVDTALSATGSRYDQCHLAIARGWYFAGEGDREAALLQFQLAIADGAAGPSRSMRLIALAETARTRANLGDHEGAREVATRALQELQQIDASEWALETFEALLDALRETSDSRYDACVVRALRWLAEARQKIGDEELLARFELRSGVRKLASLVS